MRKENYASSDTPRNFRNRLWFHRKKMGYSQKMVARLLGHQTVAHVSDYEREVRLPSLETALKLEIVLCTPVAFLFPRLYSELKEVITPLKENLRSPIHA